MKRQPDAALATQLRELKIHCGISYQQLGDAIGVSKPTAFRYLNAAIPVPADRLVPIAHACGYDVQFLLMAPGSPLPKCARQFRQHRSPPLMTSVI